MNGTTHKVPVKFATLATAMKIDSQLWTIGEMQDHASTHQSAHQACQEVSAPAW